MILYLAITSAGHAFTVDFCGWYNVDYQDADPGTGDDYFTNNDDRPARGARLVIQCEDCGGSPPPVYDDDLPWDDASTACTGGLTVNGANHYSIKLYAKAEVNGNELRVLNNDTDNAVWVHVNATSWSPTANTTKDVVTGLHDAWNIAAAAGWAMRRRSGGLVGETFTFFTQECDIGGGCQRANGVYLDAGLRDNKYVIVHEMGHMLLDLALGADDETESLADVDGCFTWNSDGDAHEKNSKEYQSKAAAEGWAHYYAAVAFNNTTQNDCWFRSHKKVDWDLDQNIPEETWVFSCEGDPYMGSADGDYLGANCLASGVAYNRATEFDWLRFLWDADTDYGMDFDDLVEMWVAAGPDTWNVDGDSVHADNPAERFEAAFATDWASVWSALAAYEGVHR